VLFSEVPQRGPGRPSMLVTFDAACCRLETEVFAGAEQTVGSWAVAQASRQVHFSGLAISLVLLVSRRALLHRHHQSGMRRR
jgi:hypothetical protein